MCTVSFISINNKFIITSNRDEQISRPRAFEPKEEIINGCKIIYPKDPKAGGTWFAVKENGMAAVLLNGAYKKHIPIVNYSRSRGLLVLDIIGNSAPFPQLEKIDLKTIEPFTLILFDTEKLIEFRWDGTNKHFKGLNTKHNYIWSSATLYSDTVARQRENLFLGFLNSNNEVNEKSLIDFHRDNNGDFENGFVIDRNNGLKTLSITQAVFETDEIVMSHLDLIKNKKHSISLPTCVLNQLS